jgi:glycosyltransferase involved in cell wall biosynthesis
MKKILHITNWYPNFEDSLEGIFVKEQFDIFSEVTDARLVNVQVRGGKKWLQFRSEKYSDKESSYFILTKFKRFKILEILTTILLLWVLYKEKYKQYDLLHFHIAYPLLGHYHWWKKLIKTKILLSEHWTAYNRNFGLPLTSHKVDNIKEIFHQQIPVVCVSKALVDDIVKFSGCNDFPFYILPNVIDLQAYKFQEEKIENEVPLLFMLNGWNPIKNPFPILEATAILVAGGARFKLIAGGNGPMLEGMKKFAQDNNLGEFVVFPGQMKKGEVADTLLKTDAFITSSKYETFSVSCAQALCCGVPLIAPPIPCILEYAGENDILVVETNDAAGWVSALQKFFGEKAKFNRKTIAQKARSFLAIARIQQDYIKIVDSALRG